MTGTQARIVAFSTGPARAVGACPHRVCRQWSAGPCTVNLLFLAPPEWGEDV